jgi:CRP-like cAMP-binding protein
MLDALPVIPLFEGFTAEQIAVLTALFERFSCPPGTVIFEQGSPPEFLYLILKGGVSIIYKPYDGPKITITRLKDGDVFGWSAVIGGKKYTSSVVSDSDLDSLRIRRENLWDLLNDHPETGKIIIDRLALNVSPRWKKAHEQIHQFIDSNRKKP